MLYRLVTYLFTISLLKREKRYKDKEYLISVNISFLFTRAQILQKFLLE